MNEGLMVAAAPLRCSRGRGFLAMAVRSLKLSPIPVGRDTLKRTKSSELEIEGGVRLLDCVARSLEGFCGLPGAR